MSKARRPLMFCVAIFLVAATWTAFAMGTGIGVLFYLVPGVFIAEALYPRETSQPFVPDRSETLEGAFGELVINIMIRCGIPQTIVAIKVSAAFWLIVVPPTVFVASWLHQRQRP